MAEEKIGEWTQSTLIRFLRDFQDQQPQQFLNKLRVDQLQVDTLFNLKPQAISLLTDNEFTYVGKQGAPPFENSWVYFGSGAQPGYFKDPFGFVHLKGLLKNGTINTPMFTLPPGFRPLEADIAICMSNGAAARLDVNTNGQVVPVSGSNAYYSIDNVVFRTTL